MASLRSTALSDRLRLFRGIVVILTRSAGLVRGARMVLALVVFLSGAFGISCLLTETPNPTAKCCLGQSALVKE
jgi:hypothetical protein